ncbi:DJ-1/PfpI family protein [Streptomyces cinereoruber]|uniref:DJ-1/PfpI family protein n=1 Tax=Streptomyces cinereoruber TaxID=67260 RepID=UPI00364495B4
MGGRAERLVAVVGFEAAELLDIACVTTGLAMANGLGDVDVPYRVRVVGPGGDAIRCGTGLTLGSDESLERTRGPLDTLVVSGGLGVDRFAADARLVGHVRRLARESRRVASVCTGAGVLAARGSSTAGGPPRTGSSLPGWPRGIRASRSTRRRCGSATGTCTRRRASPARST